MVLTAGYQLSGPHHSSAGYGYSLTEGSNLSCPCKHCPPPYFYRYLYHYHIFHNISFHWDLSLVTAGESERKVKSLSRVRLFATPWTVAHQAPPSMGFSRQEYWSGLPFLSPGDLSDPGIEPRSPTLQADILTSEPPRKGTTKGEITREHQLNSDYPLP